MRKLFLGCALSVGALLAVGSQPASAQIFNDLAKYEWCNEIAGDDDELFDWCMYERWDEGYRHREQWRHLWQIHRDRRQPRPVPHINREHRYHGGQQHPQPDFRPYIKPDVGPPPPPRAEPIPQWKPQPHVQPPVQHNPPSRGHGHPEYLKPHDGQPDRRR